MASPKLEINLIDTYRKDSDILSKIKSLNLLNQHAKFKVGQVISFNGGYNNDIRYTSEITGFDLDGGIYVFWDCYWFPIKDDSVRNIETI